ncbi:MAG: hypothetical protein ACYTF6_01150 [Planctomycetota bacterium]|jgi:hypothetical protein
MIHGAKARSVRIAAGFAIVAAAVGVMACPARAGERPGADRAAATGDKDARQAKEHRKLERQRARAGKMFDTAFISPLA